MSDLGVVVHLRCPGTEHVVCGLPVTGGSVQVPADEVSAVDECVVCLDLVGEACARCEG
jgi:hypothetical protein